MAQAENRTIDEPLPTSTQAPRLYMVGMIALAVIPALALIAAFALAWAEKPAPDVLQVAVTICLTALAGLFGYQKGQQAA